MATIYSNISSGPDAGKRLVPHLHKGGYYVASTSRFEKDYVKVRTLEELEALIRAGYGARLKAPDSKNAASIIVASSIHLDGKPGSHPCATDLLPAIIEETDLDRESISKRRKEQAFLRAHLLGGRVKGFCEICGRELPHELLVAAHIKIRSQCSREERLDFNNVAALMCKLGCDALYEGLFVLIENGQVRSNSKRSSLVTPHLKSAIDALEGNVVSRWSTSKVYYEWHKNQCERA